MTDTDTQTDMPIEERGGNIWMRGLFMIILAIFFAIAESLLVALAVVQFFWVAITKEKNRAIADFGASMSEWLAAVGRYQTFVSDERPFPWASWPKADR